jgi:hypothetical protein
MRPNSNFIDLYELVPEAYRVEDAAQGYPLRALLELVNRQARNVQEDIAGLWDDFFIETCADWVIPYVGALVANNPLHEVGSRRRADVARTIYYRRRKGTLPMLEELARDVTGWGAHAVAFFEQLGWTQHLNHLRRQAGPNGLRRDPNAFDRVGTAHIRNPDAMDRIDSPFDLTTHTVDVRPMCRLRGWYNIRNLGFFLWRLRSYRMERAEPAAAASNPAGLPPYRFHFNPFELDAPLFTFPDSELSESGLATELHVPGPIRAMSFRLDLEEARRAAISSESVPPTSRYFGPTSSIHLRRTGNDFTPVDIVCANLSEWERPPCGVMVYRSADLSGFGGLSGIGELAVTIGEVGPITVTVAGAPATAALAATALETALRSAHATRGFTGARAFHHNNRLHIIPGLRGAALAFAATAADPTSLAELGLNALEEVHGDLSGDLSDLAYSPLTGTPQLGASIGSAGPQTVTLTPPLTDATVVATQLRAALQAALPANPAFANADALALGNRVLVLSGVPADAVVFMRLVTDPVTVERLKLADRIAVDPRLGRFTLGFGHEPATSREMEVSYNNGFSTELGGGPYERPTNRARPARNRRATVSSNADFLGAGFQIFRVGGSAPAQTLAVALGDWVTAGQPRALIEIQDNRIYRENIVLATLTQNLVIAAADRCRPTFIGDLTVTGTGGNGRLRVDGLWIRGQAQLNGRLGEFQLVHSTLLPAATPSVVIASSNDHLRCVADHSVTGHWFVPPEVVAVEMRDTICDAVSTAGTAPPSFAAANGSAGPPLTLERVTLLGEVVARELPLASEVIFRRPITIERKQTGCIRFSYVPNFAGQTTPRRFRCQPDLALEGKTVPAEISLIRARLAPAFTSARYGDPGYGQLSLQCAQELCTGAEDGAEMGAFHDLLQPQRATNLRVRLDEYLPFGLNAGLIYIT